MLVALYPRQQDMLDAALAASLNGLPPDGCDEVLLWDGRSLAPSSTGAARMDGRRHPRCSVLLPEPGLWQPTPPGVPPGPLHAASRRGPLPFDG